MKKARNPVTRCMGINRGGAHSSAKDYVRESVSVNDALAEYLLEDWEEYQEEEVSNEDTPPLGIFTNLENKMSYDLSIGDEAFNTTYNHGKMFRKATRELWDSDKGIRFIYGIMGFDSVDYLIQMYSYFVEEEEELSLLEPSNGCGSYTCALEFIGTLLLAAIRNRGSFWEGD